MEKEKKIEVERLVFFSDAVIAIAITLLALDLKIEKQVEGKLQFSDILTSWERFAAFGLSFIIIAVFWKVHHDFFQYIKKVNNKLVWFNIIWLLFIVMLPFSSTLVSSHLRDTPAIVTYSINVLFVTIMQNIIWDYALVQPGYLKEDTDPIIIEGFRIGCNLAMINAIIAIAIAFFSPMVAFIVLFVRLPMILAAKRFRKRAKMKRKR